MSKIVYFFKMDGCGPCQRVKPFMQQISNFYKHHIQTVVVDFNERPDIAANFGVMATPTIIFTYNGHRIGQVDGGDTNKIANFYKQLAQY
jgi:thioredoxin-like negative regulator of GroEL